MAGKYGLLKYRFLDYMQNFPFWLLDVTPGGDFPFFVFLPITGFSAISAPEISAETQEITPGNAQFKHYVITRGNVSSLTLSRGAQFWDSDYWRWIKDAVIGKGKIRRNLLLIQYMNWSPAGRGGAVAGSIATGAELGLSGQLGLKVTAGLAAVNVALSAVEAGFGVEIHEFAPRVPGRAWLLRDCIPTRYKVASDFDANSADVSLMELDLQPRYFEEITLTSII